MPLLQIALEDGFDNDTVSIRIDGDEVFRKTAVTTRTQISLADSFEAEVGEGPVQLEVEVPSRGVRETITVDPRDRPFVAISLREGRITARFPEQLGHA